ncbi:MAG: cupredoxin domain-containing protein, partial [Acidimicrobiales bacterium]
PWPLAAAAAVGIAAVGLASGVALVITGVLAAVVVTFAWLGQAWREHPTWRPALTDRLNDRFIVPIGLPGTVVTLVGVGVISFSRVLLAVSKTAATFVALAAALAILGGCAWVAARVERIGQAALAALAAFSAVAVVSAGIAGAVRGEREFHPHEEARAIELVARGITFLTAEIEMVAGEEARVRLVNEDPSVQHNFALLEGSGTVVFAGDVFAGPAARTYTFAAPAAGTYAFRCDVHPAQMKGTARVVAASGTAAPAPAPPTTLRAAS